MRKRKLLAVVMSALCIASAIPSVPAFADGEKVVTLGADLTEDQKQALLRYFGIAGQSIRTLTITNQDEREHLGAYVPLEQIGTHTYSSALVNPTNSGGIQVRTANLTWVTSNMIATTLSTSGVVNCEVLAASPFAVSGTGALTGILMAYESAVGTELDSSKKEVATQELITTTTIANNIGQAEATDIVNEAKMQVIQGNVVNENDIDIIIDDVAEEESIELSASDRELLRDLMKQIAEQDYDYEDMKETLERVEQNMDTLLMSQQTQQSESGAPAPAANIDVDQTAVPASDADTGTDQTETPETLPEDSILGNADPEALGDSVVTDSTLAPEQTEAPQPETMPSGDDIQITTSDEYTDSAEQAPDGGTSGETNAEQTEAPVVPDTESDQGNIQVDGDVVPEQTEANPDVQQEQSDEYGIDTMMPELEDPMFEVPDEPTAPVLTMIPAEEMELAPLYDEEKKELLPAGINELTICFQREDILAGTGAISLMNGFDSSVIETIPRRLPSARSTPRHLPI